MTPSTPAVLRPVFCVTRRTANNLAANEWVSNHCKAFTLPQRRSRVAFAIRICSRCTCRSAVCQSMPFHCATLEDAPIIGSTVVVICFSSSSRFHKFSCEVRPVGRRLTFVPGDSHRYPDHYSLAFAFSDLPIPPRHGLASQSAVPQWGARRGFHVPRNEVRQVRCLLSTGKLMGHERVG